MAIIAESNFILVDKIKKDGLYWLLGLLFLGYLVARAIILPITIDEGGTFFNAVPRPIWDIITYVDPVPNNHILNTLLIKLFVQLFGVHALVLRLPNILAFILYYAIAVCWIKKLSPNRLFGFFSIVVFTCNPYLIDFFSLARGYGLSISLMFASMYLLFIYFENKYIRNLYYCMALAGLAVYANFTLLNFYMALLFLSFLLLLQAHWNRPVKSFVKQFGMLCTITLFWGLLCFLPIYRMVSTQQLQYWGTSGFYSDTLLPLMDALQYGNGLFIFRNDTFNAAIYILIFAVMCLYALRKCFTKEFNLSNNYFVCCIAILAGTIGSTILQFYLIGTPFLNARGSVFLVVLFTICFILFIWELISIFPKWRIALLLPFILIGALHSMMTINFYSCREWWFDADTKNVLAFLEENHRESSGQITLNTSWLFNTSFQFHILEKKLENVSLAPFRTELQPDGDYNYYYCERKDVELLEENYTVITSFNRGNNVLMQKRK